MSEFLRFLFGLLFAVVLWLIMDIMKYFKEKKKNPNFKFSDLYDF